MEISRKLPIGRQSFSNIRNGGFIYVDKTQYAYQLILQNQVYFLSRPRRFGKSLFLSTLEAYFLGKRELFQGLYLEKAEEELAQLENREAWQEYPVLYLDLNGSNYKEPESLSINLDTHLVSWEARYGAESSEKDLSTRFRGIIRRAYEKTGRQVVILIDEYDKPLLETIDNPKLNEAYRDTLRAFYSVIKSSDQYLRFALLVGITKFGKISVFSGLNNLNDISMDKVMAGICGITEPELLSNFSSEISALANELELSEEEILRTLRQRYDGYLFARKGDKVYNPFSLLNVFDKLRMDSYWYATGTPTFLVEYLKVAHYDLPNLDGHVLLTADAMEHYIADARNALPILYQAGYLTIKGYIAEGNIYRLGFPNDEVRYGFLNSLLPAYTSLSASDTGLAIWEFVEATKSGDVDGVMTRLQTILAGIPYVTASPDEAVKLYERDYQAVIYVIFSLLGQFVQTEVQNAGGRADCVVHTQEVIYVFEFKLWSAGTPEKALEQIRTSGYALPYQSSGKRVLLVGVSFDDQKRTIGAWKVEEL